MKRVWSQNALRAYDVRGKYPSEVNEYLAERIGLALSKLGVDVIYIGRDCRSSSHSLFRALTKGLASGDVEVYDLGEIPNPLCYYMCFKDRVNGVYVTASHNPPEYNGFKFIRSDGTSMLEEYEELKKLLKSELKGKYLGKVTIASKEVVEPYLEELSRVVTDVEGVKVVVATFGGVVNRVLPRIAEEFGLKLYLLHPKIRSDFYGLRPEPSSENLRQLSEEVIRRGADLGVGFDGDADRAVIVDDEGQVLDGSKTGYLLISNLAGKGDIIVLTPDTSSTLVKLAEKIGAKIIWSRIGHAFIERKVKRYRAVLGIEQSSHFYHGYLYPFSDGLLTMLKICEIVKSHKISELLHRAHFPPIVKFYIDVVNDDVKRKVVRNIALALPEAMRLDDGVKIVSERGWVLIRESQTMPEVNVCIEALTESELNILKEKLTKTIKKLKESNSVGESVRGTLKQVEFL